MLLWMDESTGRRLECLWGVVGSCGVVVMSAAGGMVGIIDLVYSLLAFSCRV